MSNQQHEKKEERHERMKEMPLHRQLFPGKHKENHI
jgi:hypothetical protein